LGRTHILDGPVFGGWVISLQWAYFANDMRSGSGERVILIGFYPHFALAFYVFLDLLVLHLLGWFVSISADAFVLHLKAPQLA